MKEELITYETAKLAKEKGFEIETKECFSKRLKHSFPDFRSGEEIVFDTIDCRGLKTEYLDNDNVLLAYRPTQSLLKKWLREVHRIDIYCYPNYDIKGVSFQINIYTDPYSKFTDTNHFYKGGFKTYEEALELGLQEALKLISWKIN